MPFVVITFRPLPPEFKLFNITGELNGVEISLYTLKIDINVKGPFFIKLSDDGIYDISTIYFQQFSIVSKELKFIAYKSAAKASSYMHESRKQNNDRFRFKKKINRNESFVNKNNKHPKGKENTKKQFKPVRETVFLNGSLQEALKAAGIANN